MGVRKNVKFLSSTEREDFVKACVLMKAEIVNPGAPPAQHYSRWDEYNAIHQMIQAAFAPGAASVNFGHGGSGAFSFLSWHRYFLVQFESQLQSHVPGVMVPYWDWTNPASVMTDTFLGPNGTVNSEVRSGYFAANAPGTGTNPTPAPPWWPSGLTGWQIPAAFGGGSGPLRRGLGLLPRLPTATDLRESLASGTYPAFQNALESGVGLTSGNTMHNRLHGWIGGLNGQMSVPAYSPAEPFFYLHHCNIDRLWAMWQRDGHAGDYPTSGPRPHHLRNDLMYPWVGGAPGYGTTAGIAASIPMPDFSAMGAKRNVDTLDHRALGYTYDTLPILGVGLDGTGSMSAITPDPMVTAAPDVTKWAAATRGVSALLQDCETVAASGSNYVLAGIKTFRTLAANEFATVFAAPGYGLVKSGGTYGRSAFDSAVGSMTPAGGTPLADALQDAQTTMVDAPEPLVAGEQRYLAMLTDGLLTTGSPMSSIPDHSFDHTAVFAMGFGTGADVDYATLASMVAKGVSLTTPQVFHGENAGTIDKFYSSALAQAIGFTGVIDPVFELFAGEHTHVSFAATSADDAFWITVQGLDFTDDNWIFHLDGPDGLTLYGEGTGHVHAAGDRGHTLCLPDVTATRANGRLSLLVQRGTADDSCWVGAWELMVAYRARRMDAMLMPTVGELMLPVSAGPVRGKRFERLLATPAARVPSRNVRQRAAHRFDERPLGTNNSDQPACTAVVNIYARTRLRLELVPSVELLRKGERLSVRVEPTVLQGNVTTSRAFARLISPANDLAAAVFDAERRRKLPPELALPDSTALRLDSSRVLAFLERENRKLAKLHDRELPVVQHDSGALHIHVDKPEISGTYHLGVYIEGSYCPDHETAATDGHSHGPAASANRRDDEHDVAGGPCDCARQPFTRVLSTAVALPPKARRPRSS